MVTPETFEKKSPEVLEKIPYISYIKELLTNKQRPTLEFIENITTNIEKWENSYNYFNSQKERDNFFLLSPLFFEKFYKKASIFDLILKRPYSACVSHTFNESQYEAQQEAFWELYGKQDFSIYTEIHLKLLKNASSEELYALVCDLQQTSMLKVVITRGFFTKLLQEKNDLFFLLELLLQQEILTPDEKHQAIYLLQEKVDITSINYCKTVMTANNRDMVEKCFMGSVAKPEWLTTQKNSLLSLRIPVGKLSHYMTNLKCLIAADSNNVLCQLVIANADSQEFRKLLQYEWTSENDTVGNIVRLYLKTQIKTISTSLDSFKSPQIEIKADLKRDFENCLLNPKLQELFSLFTGGFSAMELYALMCISSLNPACHKLIANNKFTRELLIKNLREDQVKNLVERSPYFYLEEYRNYFEDKEEDKKTDFFAALLLQENTFITDKNKFGLLCKDFFSIFDSKIISLILARDPELRNKMIEKATWERRSKFNSTILTSFVLAAKKFIEQEPDPQKKIDIYLELIEYSEQEYVLPKDVHKYVLEMIDHHHKILVQTISNNENAKILIMNLATQLQREFLLKNYPEEFANFTTLTEKESNSVKKSPPYIPYNKRATLSFNFNIPSTNETSLEIVNLSPQLNATIPVHLKPEDLKEARSIIETFMDQEVDPNISNNAYLDYLKPLSPLLRSCTNEKKSAAILLEIVNEKKGYDEFKKCIWEM